MSKHKIGILGTGSYLPKAVLTNKDLEKLVNTNDEWIVERSGIHERRICAPDEDCVTMGVIAARQALAAAGIEPEQLSYIVMGTNTSAYFFPASAIQVQDELGLSGKVAAFDVQAGCSGFNYALYVAERLVAPEGICPGHRLGCLLPLYRLDRPVYLSPLRGRGRGGGDRSQPPQPHPGVVHRLQPQQEALLRIGV